MARTSDARVAGSRGGKLSDRFRTARKRLLPGASGVDLHSLRRCYATMLEAAMNAGSRRINPAIIASLKGRTRRSRVNVTGCPRMGHRLVYRPLHAANESEGYGRGFRFMPDVTAPGVAKMASPLRALTRWPAPLRSFSIRHQQLLRGVQ